MYESGEMYLETILILKKDREDIRAIDIANKLNFSKASVSRALGILKDDNYISIEKTGYINLTSKGLKKANDIYEKHIVISKFLQEIIDIPYEIAEEDACKIEHIISDETFLGLKTFLNNK